MSLVRRSRSPLALLGSRDRAVLYALGVVSAVQAASLVGIAWAISSGVVSLIERTGAWREAALLGAASAVLRAITVWLLQLLAARSALGAKERLRAELVDRVLDDPGTAEGPTAALATHGLDELDDFFTVFLPTLVKAATIPLVAGAAILLADWLSALIVVLTIPLVPLFMSLIGRHTEHSVADAVSALERLSDHLVELARGLPVLVGLGRAREQARALREIAQRQHDTTMVTLRTAFLSALALELIATLSVAVVAVFIGVRLVYGQLPLEIGLFALLLAPECYTPFREAGKAFHASEEGVETLQRVRSTLEAPQGTALATGGPLPVRVERLGVRYPGRSEPAVSELSFEAPAGRILLLDGPSGAGKSTVFAVLSGRLRHRGEGAQLVGTVTGVEPGGIAWLPQRPRAVAETVRGELELYADDSSAAGIDEVLDRLGLLPLAAAPPARLSPGEQRRLGFARVMLRARSGASLVLLDEPTAHLDPRSAAVVLEELLRMREAGTAVIVASHDARVRALADAAVSLAGGSRYADSAAELPAEPAGDPVHHAEAPPPAGSARRELLAFLRPVAGRFALAAFVGALAALFAVSLTGLSAWLIVEAAKQPPILLLLTAIVGVRFFGIGRAVLRYSERLITHSAVFTAIGELRAALWSRLSRIGFLDRAVLDSGRALERIVRDADLVRDLAVRVIHPIAVAVLVSLSALLAVWLIHPPVLGAYALALLLGLLVAPLIALLADRAASSRDDRLRGRVLRRLVAVIAAADDLRSNGVDSRVREQLAQDDHAATEASQRGALALGLGNAVLVLAGAALAVAMLPLTQPAVSAGTLDGALVAVLALLPLGLIEVLADHVGAVQQAPVLRDALRRVAATRRDEAMPAGERELGDPIQQLELDRAALGWPGMTRPLVTGLSARLQPGDWLTVTGPSGSGKSTLLMLLLGRLPAAGGVYRINGIEARQLHPDALLGRIAWCPQEGHLFHSTLRGNLLIARSREQAPDDQEMTEALQRVGLGPLLARLPLGLDTPLGSAGAHLSGGERQRVAVARTLLAEAEVVLLDEPTAHLDEEAATALIADLRSALADRITVLVTHRSPDARSSDQRIRLGEHVAAIAA